MNKERIEQAIAIMKRAGQVYMAYFHSRKRDPANVLPGSREYQTTHLGRTEEELHQCGAAACFAGWVSVSPEFKAAGGWPGIGGTPYILDEYSRECEGSGAIAYWLGISPSLASGLVYNEPQPGSSNLFYGVGLEHVTREQVISKLEELLEQARAEA